MRNREKHPLEYSSWYNMKNRVFNKNFKQRKDYGGRGITVCMKWLRFSGFYKDMGNRPTKAHTLERIDNNGNYCKENCRWATRAEQALNRRGNKFLTYNGETRIVKHWAEKMNIKCNTLVCRLLKSRWSVEKALTTKVHKWARN